MPNRPGAFKRRLRLALLATSLGALLIAQLLIAGLEWRAGARQLSQEHASLAEVLAANASAALVFNDRSAAEETLNSAWRTHDVRSAALFDARDVLVAEVHAPSSGATTSRGWLAAIHGHGEQAAIAGVSIKGQQVGKLYLAYDHSSLEGRLWSLAAASLLTCGLVAGLALLVSYNFARIIAGPVERLSQGIAEVRRSRDFSRRVPEAGYGEFGQLTSDFNGLLGDLRSNEELRTELLGELRRALADAEAANVAKSQFLANMSHEIRTPLNGVLGMTQALALDSLAPTQRERVEVIRQSGEGLLAILNDILDLSKIEAGHFDLEVLDFELEQLTQGVYATFADVADTKKVIFSVEIDPQAAGVWRGDSARVRQIIYNLVSNALKFTEQGKVTVAVAKLDGGELEITVSDTGLGIPADKVDRLFSKFYQTDSSNTRRFGGTGLGLAICRELAALMGGTVRVTSQEGVGSTFSLTLPLQYLGAPAVRPQAGEHEELGAQLEASIRILAAEDHPANQLVLRALLGALGIVPTIVGNGRLALEAWSMASFDLILMDVQMPEMDGVEATRAIREAEAMQNRPRTPIVALSANAMHHQVQSYLASGMDAHLPKPLQLMALLQVLESVPELLSLGTEGPSVACVA